MPRRWAPIFAGVLTLSVAAGILVSGEGGRRVPARPLFGFNDALGQSTFGLQAGLGASIRRLPVGWNEVEPLPGVWRWAPTDQLYRELRAHGLRPLFVAAAPPCWSHPSSPCNGIDVGGTPPDPGYDHAWAEFILRLAKRYPGAAAIEIWNEENTQPEFLPYPSPVRYTQLLTAAFHAVRSVSKTMPVISGGLFAGQVSGSYGIADARFLAAMYAAGAKGAMNGIGIHIYPDAASTRASLAVSATEGILNQLERVRAAADDASTPIWITELGVSTEAGPLAPNPVSESQQAADLIAILRQLVRDHSVEAVIIHRLVDPSPSAGQTPYGDSGYGVFRWDRSPKPAACALSKGFDGRLKC